MICAVSIMIPSMAAGSVATIFGSAPGSDHTGNVLQELVHACALGGAILVKAHKRIYFFCRQMANDGWRLASQLAHWLIGS